MTRYFIFVIIIITLENYPLITISLILIINIVYISYITYKRPAKLRKLIMTIFVNEFFVSITILASFTLAIFDKRGKFENLNTRNKLGWIIIGSNMSISFFMAIMSVYDNIILIVWLVRLVMKKWKYYKEKTKKIVPWEANAKVNPTYELNFSD